MTTDLSITDKIIGTNLRRLRKERKLSVSDSAKKLGISGNHLSNLELGNRTWKAVTMLRYERILLEQPRLEGRHD